MDEIQRDTVEQALGGDRGALEVLIRQYSRLVYAQAWNVVREPETAEDVVQETFLRAYASRAKLREPEKFVPWLLSIARNRALDAVRRRKPEFREADGPAAGLPDRPADDAGPRHRAEGRELRERIFAALAALPEHHRAAVTLRYLEGMDYAAIRRTTGLSDGALRRILGRALGALKTELMPYMTA